MPVELGIVKVGKSEWLLAKLTPLSLTSENAGAVCGVTIPARRASGTKKKTLRRGLAQSAGETPAKSTRSANKADRFIDFQTSIAMREMTRCSAGTRHFGDSLFRAVIGTTPSIRQVVALRFEESSGSKAAMKRRPLDCRFVPSTHHSYCLSRSLCRRVTNADFH